jgi:hypothetical protein
VRAVRTDAHEDVPGSERLSAIARVAPTSTLKPGDTAVLTVDAEQLHLFDVETGDSIN